MGVAHLWYDFEFRWTNVQEVVSFRMSLWSLDVKKRLSNVLITGESNFDARIGQEMFNWSDVHFERNKFLKNYTLESKIK